MNFREFWYKKIIILAILAILVLINSNITLVKAADLSALSDQMSRMKQSPTKSNHTITFTTPTGVAAGQTIVIAFPTGFVLAGVLFSDMDLTDDGADLQLGGAPAGAVWGATAVGQNVTFTSGTGVIAGPSIVTVEIGSNALFGVPGANQITNCTVAQNNTDPVIDITAGSGADTGGIAVEILAEDQIAVTATVLPSITFTLVTTTLSLGTLTDAIISDSATDAMTIRTNATNGYTIYIRDEGSGAAPGLYKSAVPPHLIPSATALLVIGAEGYGAQCAKTGGSGACQAPYNVSSPNVGGLLRTNTTFASYGFKPAGVESYTVSVSAAISSATEAGSYADTLTVIAVGNF